MRFVLVWESNGGRIAVSGKFIYTNLHTQLCTLTEFYDVIRLNYFIGPVTRLVFFYYSLCKTYLFYNIIELSSSSSSDEVENYSTEANGT